MIKIKQCAWCGRIKLFGFYLPFIKLKNLRGNTSHGICKKCKNASLAEYKESLPLKVGLICARMQPVHKGHEDLLTTALRENDLTVIFLNCIQDRSGANPYSLETRIKMIKSLFANSAVNVATTHKHYNSKHRIWIIPTQDIHLLDSNNWGIYLIGKLSNYVDLFKSKLSLYTGNDVKYYDNLNAMTGVPVKVKTLQRGPISATNVRKAKAKGDKWQDLVPKSVAEILEGKL